MRRHSTSCQSSSLWPHFIFTLREKDILRNTTLTTAMWCKFWKNSKTELHQRHWVSKKSCPIQYSNLPYKRNKTSWTYSSGGHTAAGHRVYIRTGQGQRQYIAKLSLDRALYWIRGQWKINFTRKRGIVRIWADEIWQEVFPLIKQRFKLPKRQIWNKKEHSSLEHELTRPNNSKLV